MINKKGKWQPIFPEEKVKPRLLLIADTIENIENKFGYSLLSGNTGIAIFLYYYWQYTKDDKYLEKANALILEILNLEHHPFSQNYSISNGTAGFMWAMSHLIKNEFIEGDCNDLFSKKESYLNHLMETDIKNGKYDFLHNALGASLYFIKTPNSISIGYIERLIIELEKISEKDVHGFKWKSNDNLNNEGYNLGLSHGVASIIAILGKVYKTGILEDKTRQLIEEAVRYLLSKKSNLPSKNNKSFFPHFVFTNNKNIDYNSRLAWCYGDLGIGIILWQVSRILQNKKWENTAIEILLQTTSRKDSIKESVIDGGICHGSSGIAHIYNRIYQWTGISTFKEASIYWLNDTLNKAIFDDGLAGYKTFYPEDFGGWTKQAGILEGIAGIGLVLLSATSKIEPKWDECLLLS